MLYRACFCIYQIGGWPCVSINLWFQLKGISITLTPLYPVGAYMYAAFYAWKVHSCTCIKPADERYSAVFEGIARWEKVASVQKTSFVSFRHPFLLFVSEKHILAARGCYINCVKDHMKSIIWQLLLLSAHSVTPIANLRRILIWPQLGLRALCSISDRGICIRDQVYWLYFKMGEVTYDTHCPHVREVDVTISWNECESRLSPLA